MCVIQCNCFLDNKLACAALCKCLLILDGEGGGIDSGSCTSIGNNQLSVKPIGVFIVDVLCLGLQGIGEACRYAVNKRSNVGLTGGKRSGLVKVVWLQCNRIINCAVFGIVDIECFI